MGQRVAVDREARCYWNCHSADELSADDNQDAAKRLKHSGQSTPDSMLRRRILQSLAVLQEFTPKFRQLTAQLVRDPGKELDQASS